MEMINTFAFNGKELAVYGTSDKPYFVAKRVAEMLGYKDTPKAIKQHVPEKHRINCEDIVVGETPTTLARGTKMIDESGIYRLAFGSKLKSAMKFTDWITSEVLPTIRKTGTYTLSYKTPRPMLTYSINNENDLHRKTVNFIRQHQEAKRLIFTSTLGEFQDTKDKKIKAWCMGYTKGIPDFILFNPSKGYNGLIIEFKTPQCDGKLSKEQEEIIQQFKTLNYKTIVSHDYDNILLTVNDYIKNIRIPCEYCKCKFKSEKTLKHHCKYFHRISAFKKSK